MQPWAASQLVVTHGQKRGWHFQLSVPIERATWGATSYVLGAWWTWSESACPRSLLCLYSYCSCPQNNEMLRHSMYWIGLNKYFSGFDWKKYFSSRLLHHHRRLSLLCPAHSDSLSCTLDGHQRNMKTCWFNMLNMLNMCFSVPVPSASWPGSAVFSVGSLAARFFSDQTVGRQGKTTDQRQNGQGNRRRRNPKNHVGYDVDVAWYMYPDYWNEEGLNISYKRLTR